jgi:hypothetical protein
MQQWWGNIETSVGNPSELVLYHKEREPAPPRSVETFYGFDASGAELTLWRCGYVGAKGGGAIGEIPGFKK